MQQFKAILNGIFSTHKYTDPVERYQATVVYLLIGLILIGWTVYAVSAPEWSHPYDDHSHTMIEVAFDAPFTEAGVGFFSLYIISFIAIVLTRGGRLDVASWAPMATWFVSGVLLLAVNSGEPGVPSGAAVMLLMVGALLKGVRGLMVALILSLSVLFLLASGGIYDNAEISLQNIASQLMNAAILVYLFLRFGRLISRETVTLAIEERETGATVVSQIAEKVSQRATLDELLNAIVDRVRDNFREIYHAQIFLLDERGSHATLVASTGTIGRELLADAHAIAIGTRSVIGQVTATDQPVIAVAGARDTIHRPNAKLPATAVEAAFPLHVGDKLIGALDVQSQNPQAFDDPNFIATVQSLADSTALAIDNIRQYESQQDQLAEREAMVEQTREAMREVERLNEHLTGRAWADYIRAASATLGKDIALSGPAVSTDAQQWTDTLRDAASENTLIRVAHDDVQIVAVPLRIRGQVVGAMEFELAPDQALSEEDQELLNAIGDRFGLAAENARLIDESQRVAQREALVNQISGRFQTTNDITRTLEEAARGLQEALRAGNVAIRIGTPPHNG